MNPIAEFFAMDGYAVYVWVSYGLSFLGVAGLIGLALQRRVRATERLARLEALEAQEATQIQTQEDAA